MMCLFILPAVSALVAVTMLVHRQIQVNSK